MQSQWPRATPADSGSEADCLFRLWQLFGEKGERVDDVLKGIVVTIPQGMQYSRYCRVRVSVGDRVVASGDFTLTPVFYEAAIKVQSRVAGSIVVNYSADVPLADDKLFLRGECRMIDAVAYRLGCYLELQSLLHENSEQVTETEDWAWKTLLDLLRRTDLELFQRLSQKMMIQLCLRGVLEVEEMLRQPIMQGNSLAQAVAAGDVQQIKACKAETLAFGERIFETARLCLPGREISRFVQRWMHEERCTSLVHTIADPESSIGDINDAIRRLHQCRQEGVQLSGSILQSAKVQLVRRFLSDQPAFVRVAKNVVTTEDFYDIVPHVIYLPDSRGKIGAKGAMLFLAERILKRNMARVPVLAKIKFPRTWYLTTESLFAFMCSNNLEDIMEQKYKKLDQVSKEYPLIGRLFRNSRFPPAIVQGLSSALDDFGDVPLIVRSSSLLDDQPGTEFRGQYRSHFLPNNGTKQERIAALLNAIADLYASVFGPKPIEYRAQHGLLDFEEDMGIVIQEVVGCRLDNHFLPTFSGVAFSSAERRSRSDTGSNDGTIALALGMGSQAENVPDEGVVRLSVRQAGVPSRSLSEVERHANVAKVDSLNLSTGEIETATMQDFVAAHGRHWPGIEHCVSRIRGNQLQPIIPSSFDFEEQSWGVTFEGMIRHTDVTEQIRSMLDVLQDALHAPVEIEFASDGSDLYLLQCRQRGFSPSRRAADGISSAAGDTTDVTR